MCSSVKVTIVGDVLSDVLSIFALACLVVGLTLMAWGTLTLFRVRRVYQERMRIIGIISQANTADIDAGRLGEWDWRYIAFNAGPTFNEMVYKFWKPVNSFFPHQWDQPAPTGVDQ